MHRISVPSVVILSSILMIIALAIIKPFPFLTAINNEDISRDINNIKQHEDLLNSIITEGDATPCTNFSDILVRDYCNIYSLRCEDIDDFELNQICQRMLYRPHMNMFFFAPDKNDELSTLNCNAYSAEYNQLCNFRKIISNSNSNIEKGSLLCAQFSSDITKDECEFFLLVSNLESFKNISKEKLGKFIDICSRFRTNHWKSECHFLIADSLTFFAQDKYLNNISQQCTKSTLAFDYGCFSHVALNIHNGDRAVKFNNLADFCRIIPNYAKEECYNSYGIMLTSIHDSNQEQHYACSLLNDSYSDDCISGLDWAKLTKGIDNKNYSLGYFINETNLCLKMDVSQTKYCFQFLGKIISRKNGDFEDKSSYCFSVNSSYTHSCLTGVLGNFPFSYKGNIKKMVQLCNTLNFSAKGICFNITLETLPWIYPENDPRLTNSCNLFPEELRAECISRYSN